MSPEERRDMPWIVAAFIVVAAVIATGAFAGW
jgi:hypothetical protein